MATYELKDGKRVLKSRTAVPPIARDAAKPARRHTATPPAPTVDQNAARKEQK